ncbi:amidase [Planococcus salinus]|uniref:Amidase n=2 Tax=Planococcus salinus TaxID=1848460 RepID=A0A3M8P729_9BACL|nr:amidase [Planococcus salinus]
MDATELAGKIANKEITSRQATEAFIEQINKVNPIVNCMVENRFGKAMLEADEVDRRIAAGHSGGKLFGVPIGMKEAFDVEGMQTTGGLLRRQGAISYKDAEVVRKLKAEGAIILGKTNTPELCFCQETDNKLYGRTNNPHDLTRTVGGSSGGEAALIAVGGAAAGLGSDIGGSIRFPSHFNGVVGFKSGKGRVSSAGSYPAIHHDLQERMLGIGPITKTVRDARMMYYIVAEEPAREKELETFTVNVLPETDYPLSLATAHLLDSVYAAGFGHFPMEREVPAFFHESSLLWQEIMSIDGAEKVAQEAFGEAAVRPMRAYVTERLTGNSPIHRYLSWGLTGTSLFKPSEKRLKKIRRLIREGDHLLDYYLDERILVFPVYHTAAPKHGVVFNEIFSLNKTFRKYMPYVAFANVWGLPSLTVPVGQDKDGMPIGIQLISRNGNEEALFTLGEWVEKHYSGYTRAELK